MPAGPKHAYAESGKRKAHGGVQDVVERVRAPLAEPGGRHVVHLAEMRGISRLDGIHNFHRSPGTVAGRVNPAQRDHTICR